MGNRGSNAVRDTTFQAEGKSRGCQSDVKRKRRDQGRHECEVLGRGNEVAESQYAWNNCSKNPGHARFIPAPELSLIQFPHWCQHEPMLDYVRSVSALTVRLRVGYTSQDRPDGYSFSGHRGSSAHHTGSGYIYGVKLATTACPCTDCDQGCGQRHHPHQHQRRWYEIHLTTALHVVFNSEEARATKVDVFYDDLRSAVDGRNRTLFALDILASHGKEDWCVVRCGTHDEDLANRLQALLKQTEEPFTDVYFPLSPKGRTRSLCVVISHPHGRHKMVTIGQMRRWSSLSTYTTQFMYNADTCPGSSGAPVLVCSVRPEGRLRRWMGPHSEGGGRLNQSGGSIYLGLSDISRLLGIPQPNVVYPWSAKHCKPFET